MSSWQFRRFPGSSPLSSSTLLPQASPHLAKTLSSSPPTKGLSSSLASSQQVLLRSISPPLIKASITSPLERTSQSPSLAKTMYLWPEVSLNSLTSGSQLRQGPLKGPSPLQYSFFFRQQSPRVRVGCSLPFRQKQLLLSSDIISSSTPFHFSRIRSLSARLLTDNRSLVFWDLKRGPSVRMNMPIESPAFPTQTRSLWTIAVIPQAPTLLSFRLPSLRCCSQISKKSSSSCLQLQTKDYLRSSPTSFPLLRCCFRQESIRTVIFYREYSASSEPPCPSKMLTVQASRVFNCSQTMLSSQGAFAWYCTLFTLPSMLFFCSKYYYGLSSSSSIKGSSLSPSVSLLALASGGSQYSGKGGRVAASRGGLAAWRPLRREREFLGLGPGLTILQVLLKAGMRTFRTCNWLHIGNYYNPQLRPIITLTQSSHKLPSSLPSHSSRFFSCLPACLQNYQQNCLGYICFCRRDQYRLVGL